MSPLLNNNRSGFCVWCTTFSGGNLSPKLCVCFVFTFIETQKWNKYVFYQRLSGSLTPPHGPVQDSRSQPGRSSQLVHLHVSCWWAHSRTVRGHFCELSKNKSQTKPSCSNQLSPSELCRCKKLPATTACYILCAKELHCPIMTTSMRHTVAHVIHNHNTAV